MSSSREHLKHKAFVRAAHNIIINFYFSCCISSALAVGKVKFSKRKIVKVSRKCGEKFLDINVAMNVLGLMMML